MSAPDLSESRDLAAMWRERAEAAEALTQRLAAAVWAAIGHRDPPPLDGLPAEECMVVASEVRLRFDDLAMARDSHHARAERAEAIIAGRDVAPTSEELAAHDRGVPMSGWWLCVMRGRPALMRHDAVIGHSNGVTIGWWGANEARWWPLDAECRPCPWPVAP